jgi:hypothetical protein
MTRQPAAVLVLAKTMRQNAHKEDTHLDGGVDGVADDARLGLPRPEPNRRDGGAGVKDEVASHFCNSRTGSTACCRWRGQGRTRGAFEREEYLPRPRHVVAESQLVLPPVGDADAAATWPALVPSTIDGRSVHSRAWWLDHWMSREG